MTRRSPALPGARRGPHVADQPSPTSRRRPAVADQLLAIGKLGKLLAIGKLGNPESIGNLGRLAAVGVLPSSCCRRRAAVVVLPSSCCRRRAAVGAVLGQIGKFASKNKSVRLFVKRWRIPTE